jgi:hypothetical protein
MAARCTWARGLQQEGMVGSDIAGSRIMNGFRSIFHTIPNPNIDTIVPMSEDERYIDDYFFMTVSEFVVTPGSNRVRDPDGYTAMGQIQNQIWIGNFVNRFV